MRIAVVTPRMASGERGGAEALYHGLVDALRSDGHQTEEVAVHVDESCFEMVLESYARCSALDLRDYELVISTKAPTYMVSHSHHVSYLLHTMRVFYDMFEEEYGNGSPAQLAQRCAVHALDRYGLRPGRIRRHFSNGHTTYRRLVEAAPWWKTVGFTALHHPPALSGYRRPAAQDYILMPGRLHRWKRVGLVIEAYKHVKRNVPLLITGTGEDEPALRAAAAADKRIRFLGEVSDSTLIDLYADALLVPFVPKQEDYGLITIEAFKSGKPVLTCTDSGEPVAFVRDRHNGFVVEPRPKAIADRITHAIDHPRLAARMGARGRDSVAHIAWEPIVDALTGRARADRRSRSRTARSRPSSKRETFHTTVLDMQPIHPAVGGGRLRLLGLYRALGADLPTIYVGTYDWPGEPPRRHHLSQTLEEIDVPLSEGHFAAAAEWRDRAGGNNIIDTAFPQLAHHSAEYVAEARRKAAAADIVVFSHPWVYPLVADVLRQRPQLVVYDSHNVEGLLRLRLLGDNAFGGRIAAHAAVMERQLCQTADLVLACSHEDRQLFHQLYDVPFTKCLVVPNGTFTDPIVPATVEQRAESKRALDLPPQPMAMFIASFYPPNVEAARFINDTLAPALPGVTFVICGGVCGTFTADEVAPNVRLTMVIDDETKGRYLQAADVAVNPMFVGSGTNIKMFDFMAAALPIVTTDVGARGIQTAEPAFVTTSRAEFAGTLRRLVESEQLARSMGAAGRRAVVERYSWERLSPSLGRLLHRHRMRLGHARPAISVVVPTYERHDVIDALMECLARQTLRNFEVIVVDQSATPWQRESIPGIDLVYVHTDVRGAALARNTGAFYARGDVLAFTDDDCRPDADWLEAGLRHFSDPAVIGVEGLVLSDHAYDERYRPVTNVGFEGIGFMTANLFLRREIFMTVDGFDTEFDEPFREDTDLAWRALAHGTIPFASDVRVYHPPQPRAIEREARAARARFFEKDALLMKKHPERYRTLFLREAHYANTPGFVDHFLRGAARYQVDIDEFYLSRFAGRPAGA